MFFHTFQVTFWHGDCISFFPLMLFFGVVFLINDENFLGDDGILDFILDIALRLALSDLKVVVLS